MKQKILLVLVGIVLIVGVVGAVWFITGQQKKAALVRATSSATVEITPQGFVPETVMIKPGQSVEWVNADTSPHQVSSDPHPLHSSFPALAATDPLQPREHMSLQYAKKGTFGFHDEGDPLHKKGTVIVE